MAGDGRDAVVEVPRNISESTEDRVASRKVVLPHGGATNVATRVHHGVTADDVVETTSKELVVSVVAGIDSDRTTVSVPVLKEPTALSGSGLEERGEQTLSPA